MQASPKSLRERILFGIRKSLVESGDSTKVELSEKLDISFPTISKFLSQMEQRGEIVSAGLDVSSGGRRAKRYRYNSDHMLALALFLEKSETNYIVFNCLGEVKEQGGIPSKLVENGLDALIVCIEKRIADYPKINAIAIGIPGSVDNGRIFYIPGYEQFQNFDLKGFCEERFSIPVVVENDMNAAVFGYYRHKGIKDDQSLVYLYSGQNGPGAGIMVNGDIVRGNTFFAGEVSFVPQYDHRNFLQAMEGGAETKEAAIYRDDQIDAISRLVASFAATINPHTFIFCAGEVNELIMERIAEASSIYIPKEHLPNLTISDWKQDYLVGLQSLGLEKMLNSPIK